jgi:hypothetical protein
MLLNSTQGSYRHRDTKLSQIKRVWDAGERRYRLM